MKKTPLKRKTPLKAKKGFKATKVPLRSKNRATVAKRPNKRKRKTDLRKLKDQLWKLCREIQIKRYGRTCFTCGKQNLEGSNCHLGHFIPSSVCSVSMRYNLCNLRPQCYHCNINLSGNWIEYEKALKRTGIDTDMLKKQNEETKGKQYDSMWYEVKIAEYQKIL